MVTLHQPTMRTLVAARRVFWRHRPEFEQLSERQREALHDREVPWRAVMSVSGAFALLGLWRPVLASLALAAGLLVFAAAVDLTAVDPDLGATEERMEGLAPVHAGADGS